ncbi:MAG: hypothetical protein J5643_03370 [Lachnospiraceae bacterium]|nr:hypothetical protein [Lachnospiraceae bacterium]
MKKKRHAKLTNKKWALIFIGICAAALLIELILVICVFNRDSQTKKKAEKVGMCEVIRIQEETINGEKRKYTYDRFGRIASVEKQSDILKLVVDEYRYYDESSIIPIGITETLFQEGIEVEKKEIDYSEPFPYRDMEEVCDKNVRPVIFRNNLGRIRSIILTIKENEAIRLYYEYDEQGRISERKDYRVAYFSSYGDGLYEKEQKTLLYKYDESGFLSAVRISRGEFNASVPKWNEVYYRYDKDGYLISKEYAESGSALGTETFAYDKEGCLTHITFTSKSKVNVTILERKYQTMEVPEAYLTESDRLRIKNPEEWMRRTKEEAVDPYSVGAARGTYR